MNEVICVICPNSCKLSLVNGELIGYKCKRGIKFYEDETTMPKRTFSSTVKTVFKDHPVLPVKLSTEIEKALIFEVMEEINKVIIDKKLAIGSVLVKNIKNSNADLVLISNDLMEDNDGL